MYNGCRRTCILQVVEGGGVVGQPVEGGDIGGEGGEVGGDGGKVLHKPPNIVAQAQEAAHVLDTRGNRPRPNSS